ncbi:glycosyltransferase [Uliginosibacterium sp. H1]|uniref:glycosyltransferase n=1 Tax=Uliginosibacterium sp. H1 TaxID=3114757 RepID=UPI002E172150|nr:glycosyltransferase [Uliginosibacterium sp. H1]
MTTQLQDAVIPALSIVLPTYNERENIQLLLAELPKVLTIPYEAIVVDDNSPDLTWQVVRDIAATQANVHLLHRTTVRGLTSAINDGIKLARAPLVMWMDVDLSMPPAKINDLLAAIRAGADVAVGSRYVPGGGDARAVSFHLTVQLMLSKVLSIIGGWLLGCRFRDWSSGFIVLKRDLLRDYDLRGDYGEYFIDLIYTLIKHKRAKVVEVPYVLTARQIGESKTATNLWGLVRRGRKYLTTVWHLRFGKAAA